MLNNALNTLSWCTCTLPDTWNHICLFCALRWGYLLVKCLLPQEIWFCTAAVAAHLQGKDRCNVLTKRLSDPTKWKGMAFLFWFVPFGVLGFVCVSFLCNVVFLPWKLSRGKMKISSDPHKLCIVFLVLSQLLYVALACHPSTLSTPAPQVVTSVLRITSLFTHVFSSCVIWRLYSPRQLAWNIHNLWR